MDIYFVRHGQTMGNLAKRHQAEHTPLSSLGREQASNAAKEVAQLNPTHLISSNLVRAIETARPIAETTNLDITIEQNFAELFRPKYLHGKHHLSPQSIFYYALWFFGIENRKLAGESYEHIRQRITVAKNILQRYPKNATIVVVSHSVFINLFLAHLCRARALSVFSLLGFVSKIVRIPNGSITHVAYDSDAKEACKWSVVRKTTETNF